MCNLQAQMCTDVEVCNPRASTQKIKCPDDLRSTHIHPREIFCTDVQMSLQCRMCRGAMRFVLGIDIRHCIAASHKTRRGFEKLSVCLPPHQSGTEECPQVVAGGFHINRAPRTFKGRGGDEKEKVMPRKLASFVSSAQSFSLNGLSAVPSPLCPHDSTPGHA